MMQFRSDERLRLLVLCCVSLDISINVRDAIFSYSRKTWTKDFENLHGTISNKTLCQNPINEESRRFYNPIKHYDRAFLWK